MTKVNDRFGFDFKFTHKNKDGEVLWQSDWEPNQMADEGFEQMFDIYFRGQATTPSKFQIGLVKEDLDKDDTITEIIAKEIEDILGDSTYVRQDVERDDTADGFDLDMDENYDVEIISTVVEFINNHPTDAWTPATHGFMTAVTAGGDKFVCWKELSTTRTLQSEDQLNVQIRQKGKIPY